MPTVIEGLHAIDVLFMMGRAEETNLQQICSELDELLVAETQYWMERYYSTSLKEAAFRWCLSCLRGVSNQEEKEQCVKLLRMIAQKFRELIPRLVPTLERDRIDLIECFDEKFIDTLV